MARQKFTGPISTRVIAGGVKGLGNSRVVMSRFGDWQGAAAGFNKMPVELGTAVMWGQRKAAEKYVKIVRDHIDNQDLGWVPLKHPELSGDPRILVDTEAFRLAIKAWRSGYKYNAGVPKSAVDHRGRSIADYASENEFGWGNAPKRELFAPSYAEMGGHAGIKTIMTASVYSKLTRLKTAGVIVTGK